MIGLLSVSGINFDVLQLDTFDHLLQTPEIDLLFSIIGLTTRQQPTVIIVAHQLQISHGGYSFPYWGSNLIHQYKREFDNLTLALRHRSFYFLVISYRQKWNMRMKLSRKGRSARQRQLLVGRLIVWQLRQEQYDKPQSK